MRWLLLSLVILLTGCNLEHHELDWTIRSGKVYWKGPDVPALLKALEACSTAPADFKPMCTDRLQEAQTLMIALKSCVQSDLPTCRMIMAWAKTGEGRSWPRLSLYLDLSSERFDQLPTEDLDTLRPQNAFIWALWGWDDLKAVITARFIRYRTYILLALLLPVAGYLGVLGWRRYWQWQEEQADLQAEQHREEERQREREARQREAKRKEQENQAEEARKRAEEAQRHAALAAAKKLQQQKRREEAEKAEQALLASQEEAQRIMERLLGNPKPELDQTPRASGRWSALKRPTAGDNADASE